MVGSVNIPAQQLISPYLRNDQTSASQASGNQLTKPQQRTGNDLASTSSSGARTARGSLVDITV